MDIFKKINISFSLLILILISFLSGLFKDILILFLIIFIHELGHILASFKFKWNIKKINFGICGGYITYEEKIDKPFIEEFIIAISGFLSQTLFFIIILYLRKENYFDENLFELIRKYYLAILFFNFIPVEPLDGSKLLGLFFSIFLPYKVTLKIMNIISFVILTLFFIFFVLYSPYTEFSYFILLFNLGFCLLKKVKEVPYLYNKFLFERYINPIVTNKIVIVKGNLLSKMKRRKKHLFLINGNYKTEKLLLSKRFD